MALGPRVRAFGHDLGPGPWGLLRDTVPVFQMIRVTSRAGVFLALPLTMLAAMALDAAQAEARSCWRASPSIALAETLIVPIPMPQWSKLIDTRKEPPPVYRWLAEQPGRDPIVHLPMLDVYGLERRPAFHESVYMVYSTLHWKPLVNGYAGIEPKRYVEIRDARAVVPVRGVPGRAARGRHAVRDRAPQGLRAVPVGAAAEGDAGGARERRAARGGEARERDGVRAGAGVGGRSRSRDAVGTRPRPSSSSDDGSLGPETNGISRARTTHSGSGRRVAACLGPTEHKSAEAASGFGDSARRLCSARSGRDGDRAGIRCISLKWHRADASVPGGRMSSGGRA